MIPLSFETSPRTAELPFPCHIAGTFIPVLRGSRAAPAAPALGGGRYRQAACPPVPEHVPQLCSQLSSNARVRDLMSSCASVSLLQVARAGCRAGRAPWVHHTAPFPYSSGALLKSFCTVRVCQISVPWVKV